MLLWERAKQSHVYPNGCDRKTRLTVPTPYQMKVPTNPWRQHCVTHSVVFRSYFCIRLIENGLLTLLKRNKSNGDQPTLPARQNGTHKTARHMHDEWNTGRTADARQFAIQPKVEPKTMWRARPSHVIGTVRHVCRSSSQHVSFKSVKRFYCYPDQAKTIKENPAWVERA